jgi:8-oxo-dGTP pyrophosphatase MutT (NUDIX family)
MQRKRRQIPDQKADPYNKKVVSFGVIPYTKTGVTGGVEYLLIRHQKIQGGEWDFPKGRPDRSDVGPIASALRELERLTGLEGSVVSVKPMLKPIQHRYTFTYHHDDGSIGTVDKEVVLYLGEISDYLAVRTQPAIEFQWAPFEVALSLLSHADAKKILKQADSQINVIVPEAVVPETKQAEEVVSCGVIPYTQSEGELQYLVVQHFQGHWVFPNGKQRAPGSAGAVSTAICEMCEQTGITAAQLSIQPIEPVSHKYEFVREIWKGKGQMKTCVTKHIKKVLLIFVAEILPGKAVNIRLQRSESGVQKSEFKAFKWCTLDEAVSTLSLDETKQIMREGDARLRAYLAVTHRPATSLLTDCDVVLHAAQD